jgi:hypothetical protein
MSGGADFVDSFSNQVAVAADVAQGDVPLEAVVEGEDADGLLVGENVDGRLRRRFAQIHRHAGHAPGTIEH